MNKFYNDDNSFYFIVLKIIPPPARGVEKSSPVILEALPPVYLCITKNPHVVDISIPAVLEANPVIVFNLGIMKCFYTVIRRFRIFFSYVFYLGALTH